MRQSSHDSHHQVLQHRAERLISEARFSPYLEVAGGDRARALALYAWNARISSAAFEVLHHAEVILRNAIDSQFAPGDSAMPVRASWLADPTLLNEASRRRVRETVRRIDREGKSPTRGRVVAGLSFGFWRALFDKKYDGLWVSHLHHAFPEGSGDRGEVAALMSRLVPFRNRLAHHETVIHHPIGLHCGELLTLTGLIDPLAREWIQRVSRVGEVLRTCPLG